MRSTFVSPPYGLLNTVKGLCQRKAPKRHPFYVKSYALICSGGRRVQHRAPEDRSASPFTLKKPLGCTIDLHWGLTYCQSNIWKCTYQTITQLSLGPPCLIVFGKTCRLFFLSGSASVFNRTCSASAVTQSRPALDSVNITWTCLRRTSPQHKHTHSQGHLQQMGDIEKEPPPFHTGNASHGYPGTSC